jgi:hypothetical protein
MLMQWASMLAPEHIPRAREEEEEEEEENPM